MTKNQILSDYLATLRVNFMNAITALSMSNLNSDLSEFLRDMSIAAFRKLVYFYQDNHGMFKVEKEFFHLENALLCISDADDAGRNLTDDEAEEVSTNQLELYEFYSEVLDENGNFAD